MSESFQSAPFFQAWQDASKFQQAYDVGAGEAKAAFNLLREVDPLITEKLCQLVEYLALSSEVSQ